MIESIKTRIIDRLDIYNIHPINLGVFRISLGIAILFQFCVYLWPSIPLVYLNKGRINYEAFHSITKGLGYSIFDFPMSTWMVQIIFGITFLFILTLIIGYKTRIVAPILLFLLFNINQRGIFICGAEGMYSISLLTIAIFLPLNSTCTFSKFKQFYIYNKTNYSLLCFALLIQIAWIYISTGILKVDPAWQNGTALQQMFTDDPLNAYSIWWGKTFNWTQPICIIIRYVEIGIGLGVLLFPKKFFIRILVGFGLIGLHLSIITFLNLWHFCFYGITVALLILPIHRWLHLPYASINLNEAEDSKKWVFIVLYIGIISLSNSSFIVSDSILTSFIKKTPIEGVIKKIQIPTIAIKLPIHQNWGLYGNLPSNFGCVAFIGLDEKGNHYNLLTQKEQKNLCCEYNHQGQKEMNEIIRLVYFYANDIVWLELYNKILDSFLSNWKQNQPNIEIKEVEVLFNYLDGKNKIVDSLFTKIILPSND